MLAFSKYHGCGNDFIIIEEWHQDLSRLARKLCHRTTGIGADGLLAVTRKPCTMRIFNSDGSEAAMCGNGLRCFVKYCIDQGMAESESSSIETKAGKMKVMDISHDPFSCTIDLGKPDCKASSMAIDTTESTFMHQKLFVSDRLLSLSSVFIGAVHTVLYMDDIGIASMDSLGAQLCSHPIFKDRTNVDFVRVIDEHTIELITYERGVGITAACGTGACASAYIAVRDGKCVSPVAVLLPYGKLIVDVGDTIRLKGPAVKIAQGYWQEY